MPHGAACTWYPVTSRNSHDHRYHQTSLSRARDGTGRKKRNGRKDQREWLCMFQNGKPVSNFILHAWCVGRNFCGYLILRFFPNRKNSQNIVPANNSNNKVQDSFCKRHGIRLPPLQTRFDYHSLVLLYKMRSSLVPPYLCTLLPRRVSATAGYLFRKSGYPVPATRKSSTLASFLPRSIVLWNALPKEIQESNTLTKFKTRLRTHLHIWCQQSHPLKLQMICFILYFLIRSSTYFPCRLYLL